MEHEKAAIEANNRYNKKLVDLRNALGYVFGRIGMKENEVPNEIQIIDQIDNI